MKSKVSAHVFLLQLGGPKDLAGIKPFLHNLFADVLPGPVWLRMLLGRFIAWRRTPKVMPLYQAIGGGSPLLANTQAQAEALTAAMAARGTTVHTHIVMRYAPPRLPEALAEAQRLDADAPWVVLPLYPHFSYATTRSSLMEFSPTLAPELRAKLRVINDYDTEPHYIDAVSELIAEKLKPLEGEAAADVHVVFSAHGLPMKLIKEGDPYPEHIMATVHALVAKLPKAFPWTLSYQSRVGPVKWLTPSTQATLEHLGHIKTKHVVVVPISFVSEHIETLQELDLELRDEAIKAGVAHYHRVPTVGTHPKFIESLCHLVEEALDKPPQGFAPGSCLCDPRRFSQPCLCAKSVLPSAG